MKWAAADLVRIEIIGDELPESGRLPAGRDDHGVVVRLLDFIAREGIVPERGGASGAGSYAGYFRRDDGRRVRQWLAQQAEFKRGR